MAEKSALWLAAVAAVLALSWAMRWEVTSVDRGTRPAIYMVNRWTGEIVLIEDGERVAVPAAK